MHAFNNWVRRDDAKEGLAIDIKTSYIYDLAARGRQTFLGRGPDESQTSLSRARVEKTKSTHQPSHNARQTNTFLARQD